MGREQRVTRRSVELSMERINAHARCPGGTLVLALLSLGIPLSQQADFVGAPVALLRSTLGAGRRAYQPVVPEVLSSVTFERLGALLAIEAARGSLEGVYAAEAHAWAIGCVVGKEVDDGG